MEIKLSTKFFAELIGTFALVLFGTGAVVVSSMDTLANLHGVGIIGIAVAFGVSVLVMCYAIGGITGCHINPAITIAMLFAKKINSSEAVTYLIAQFIGATIASFLLMQIQMGMPGFEMKEWALGANGWGEDYQNGYNATSAFITEVTLTFLFLFVIFGATSKWGNSTMAGVAIGLVLMLIHIFAIPITGTSVNPARSFAPAIFAGGMALKQLWLFIIAPILGGILAAIVWSALDKNK